MVATTRTGNAPRLEGGKRLNLVQARLNDGERQRLDALRRQTGLSDSALVRVALSGLAQNIAIEPDQRQVA